MRKKLIVCGCSYSAPSRTLPGTSYAELLAKKLDWDLVHLARQGCSNGGIRIQIDEVIRQKPDFAIIAPTFHDRIEIPARAAPYIPPPNETKGWANDLQKHLQKNQSNGYVAEEGMKNVNYNDQPYNMICETIFSLAENYTHPYRSRKLDKETQGVIKQYINYIYDSNWKHQMDTWIMREGIIMAYLAGINFIVLPENLWKCETVRDIIPDMIPDKFLITKYEQSPGGATYLFPLKDKNKDPGYHGEPESQEYLADIYYKIISEWTK
jgi:hypothetical protein